MTEARNSLGRADRIDRSRARSWAVQVLYRWESQDRTGSVRDALAETVATRHVSPRRLPYVRQLATVLDEHLPQVDSALQGALDNWRLERLATLDRAVLRLAAAELLYIDEVPPKVSIQEGIRLAEQYGGPDSPRFVNGVLDALYKGLPGRGPAVNEPQGAGALRILVVNWQDRENPQAGGAETHLHEIFGRLARRGHRVTLLASGWKGCSPSTTLDGIEVVRVGSRYTFSVAAPLAYRRTLASRTFDVVVEDLNKVPLFTPSWTKAPVALLVHHLFGTTAFREASLPLATMTWLLERPIPRYFRDTPTMAVSESTRADLAHRGMDRALIEVIPNGIDLDLFSPDPVAPRFDEPTLLYLGRLKRYKGVDLILRAVAELRGRGVPARLLIAGKGDHGPVLEELARTLSLGDAVRFLGFVSEAEKVSLFRRSWVHVLTSPKEGWGIANLEAAACGTASIASDAPGLRDSVVDGTTGYLVPHGDVGRLSARLGEVLGDPDLRDGLGRGARAFAERYSWDNSALATEAFLNRLVTDSRHG